MQRDDIIFGGQDEMDVEVEIIEPKKQPILLQGIFVNFTINKNTLTILFLRWFVTW